MNHPDHRKKTHKCEENRRHAATLEIPERAYEDYQDKLKKGYSEELPDDNADFTDRGGAYEAVRPNINARALLVYSTPRNEWTMHLQKLRSNKHQGRVHPNVTEVYVSIIHVMLGKDGPRQK